MATRGHVRDLPAKARSVKPEDGFAMVYETGRGAARTLGAMAKALRRADALVLATDPEREGEADAKAASSPSAGNMRPSAPEKETAACSSNEGTSSAVSPSPGGLSLVLAVVRLSGRSSPGVCRWAQSGQRLPGLDATPAARRTHAVGSLGAPAPGGGGAGRRPHCIEARHGTVRTHPLQVCLAPPDEAPIRSVYGRHPPRLAMVALARMFGT